MPVRQAFEELLRDAFSAVTEVRELAIHSTESRETSGSFGLGLGYVTRFFSRRSGTEQGTDYEVIQKPIVAALIKSLQAAEKATLFFDNFENVRDGRVRELIAQLMSVMADRAAETRNRRE